jgi:hypothetical protein
MLNKTTLNQLHDLRLGEMARKYSELSENSCAGALSFDERFAFLVEAEWLSRRDNRIKRCVAHADFRFDALIEDIDFNGKQGFTKADAARLAA